MWLFFPDTRGLPLEEVAALFGDADEVAVYQRDIDVDEIESDRRSETLEKPSVVNKEHTMA